MSARLSQRHCWHWWLALLCAGWLAPVAASPPGPAAEIDTARSRIGFTLKTRWGQELEGRFPQWSGTIEPVSAQRRRVRLRLPTSEVEILDHPQYSKITRGKGFFDADHHPWVEFVSDPYDDALLREGGLLGGQLTIRGVRRREVFALAPATCARPTIDCDVVATGVVYRSDYAMDRWAFALADRVVFSLHLRTRPSAAP
ncbi:YceI family protein [Luteimonas wenzhouensis]|mgnify:CR=1 FL=1|jgi:polyisoprenoid-binding protein YceI|uniref:Polyisoprenoid-binding protein n=1 Tax=Luteimonas wenzhouensis TaxID=2599615 RepID=A0A5C5TWQ7_9GAMM|nr:YceI family protein [Luteimonas wenzhouensis]NLW95538.1 polyisoprenoid-binding protein [Xanthomonadaceae bacterium]TWT17969.1 polyisoprenoid-binding protein [Luteimonas wenzhouensis]